MRDDVIDDVRGFKTTRLIEKTFLAKSVVISRLVVRRRIAEKGSALFAPLPIIAALV